ncbi:PEP-CTERM sorting domain-containing protein [Pseudoduganella sp. RAF19]
MADVAEGAAAAVPEPAAIALMVPALGLLGVMSRRRQHGAAR